MRVTKAGIVAAGVPSASLSPFAPGDVIGIFAEGISRFYRRAIKALAGVALVGVDVPGHCGPCCQGKNHGGTEDFEFHYAFLHSVALMQDKKWASRWGSLPGADIGVNIGGNVPSFHDALP